MTQEMIAAGPAVCSPSWAPNSHPDPMIDPDATKFESISYIKVLERGLKVMDATAISLCMDNKLPIVVFNLRTPGNMRRAVLGENVGTTVTA